MEMRNLGGRQIPNSHNPRSKVPSAPISLIPFFDAFVGHVNIPIWNTNMNSESGIDAPQNTILCMLGQSVADGRWRTTVSWSARVLCSSSSSCAGSRVACCWRCVGRAGRTSGG